MRQLSHAKKLGGGQELKQRMKEQTSDIMDIDDLLDDEGWDILNNLTEEELEQLNNDFDPENTLLPVMERSDHMRPINAAPMYTKEDLLGNLEKMVAKSKPVIKNETLRKKEEEKKRLKELELDEKYLKKPMKLKEDVPKHITLTKEEEELLNEATEEELIEAAEHALQQGDDDLREKILFVLEQRKIEEERAYSLIDSKLFPTLPQPVQTIGEPSPSCLIDDEEENDSLFKPMSHKQGLILDNNNNLLLQKRFSHLTADYQDDSSSCFESEEHRKSINKQRPKNKPRKFSKENTSTKNTCIERVKLYNEDKFKRRDSERKRKSKRRKNSMKMKIEHLKILKENNKTMSEESMNTDESELTIQEASESCETDSALDQQALEEIEYKNVVDDQSPIKVNCNVSVNAPFEGESEPQKVTSDEVVIQVNIDINLEDHLIGQLATNRAIELETDISETLSESVIDDCITIPAIESRQSIDEKEKLYKRNDLELKFNCEPDDNVSKMIQNIKEKKSTRKHTTSLSKPVEQKSSSHEQQQKQKHTNVETEESNTISKIKQLQQKASRRNSKPNLATEKPQVKGKLNIVMPKLDSNNSGSSASEKPKKRPSKLAFNEKNPFAKFIKKDDIVNQTSRKVETNIALKNPMEQAKEEEIVSEIISITEKQPEHLERAVNDKIMNDRIKNDDDNDSGIDRSHSVFSMYTPTDLDSRLDLESTTSETLNDTFQMSDENEKSNDNTTPVKQEHMESEKTDKISEKILPANDNNQKHSITSKIKSNREKILTNSSMQRQRSLERTEQPNAISIDENLHKLNREISSKNNNVTNKITKSKERLKKKNSNEKVDAFLAGKIDLKQEAQLDETFKRVKTRRSRRSSKSKTHRDNQQQLSDGTSNDVCSNSETDIHKGQAEKKFQIVEATSISTDKCDNALTDKEISTNSFNPDIKSTNERVAKELESSKKTNQLANEKISDQKQDSLTKARIRKKSDPFRILNKVKHFNSLYTNSFKSTENDKPLRNEQHLESAEIKSDRIDERHSNNKHTITSIDKTTLLRNDDDDVHNSKKIEKTKSNGNDIAQEKVITAAAANQNLADILREKKKNLKNQKKSRKVSIEDKLKRIKELKERNKIELDNQNSIHSATDVIPEKQDIPAEENTQQIDSSNSNANLQEKQPTKLVEKPPRKEEAGITNEKVDKLKISKSLRKLNEEKKVSTSETSLLLNNKKETNPEKDDRSETTLSKENKSDIKALSKTTSRPASPKENKKNFNKQVKEKVSETTSNKTTLKTRKEKVIDKPAGQDVNEEKINETKKPAEIKKKSDQSTAKDSKQRVTSPFSGIKLKSVAKTKKMGVVDSSKSHDDNQKTKLNKKDIPFLENQQLLDTNNNFTNISKTSEVISDVIISSDVVDNADTNQKDENNNSISIDNEHSTEDSLIKKTAENNIENNELSYFARRKRERQKQLEAEELENKNPFVCDEPEIPELTISRFYKPKEDDEDDDDADAEPDTPLTPELDSNYFAERKKARKTREFQTESPEPLQFDEDFDDTESLPNSNRSPSPRIENEVSKPESENLLSPDMAPNKKSNRIIDRLKQKQETEKHKNDVVKSKDNELSKSNEKITDIPKSPTVENKIKKQNETEQKPNENEELTDEQKHIINLKLEKEREVQRLLAEIAKMNASLENQIDIPTTLIQQTEPVVTKTQILSSSSTSSSSTHKHKDTSIAKTERHTIHEQNKLQRTDRTTNVYNKNKLLSPPSEKKTNTDKNIKNNLEVKKDSSKFKTLSPVHDRKLKPPSSQASSTSTSPLLERKLRPVNSSTVNKIGPNNNNINNNNNTKEAGLKALEDIRSKLRKVPKIERKESESEDDDVTVEEDVSEKRRKMIEEANGEAKPAKKSALELLLEKDAAGLEGKRASKEKEKEEKIDVRGVTAALLQNALLKMNGMLTNDQINSVFAGEKPEGKSITSKTSVKATAPKHKPIMKQDEETELDVVALMKCLKEDTDDLFYICINNQPKLEKNILKEVFKSVESSKKVKHLSLAMVGIIDADAKELAKALRYNKQVETLNLESNVIGMSGIDALMKVVGNHPTLREVKVSNQKQPFGGNGEECMAAAIDKNENILKFGYSFTNPGPRNKADRAIIRHNENLRQRRRQGEDVYDLKAACKIRDPWPQPWIKVKGRRLLGGLIENKASEMGRKIDVESDVGRESRGPKLRDQEAKPFDINALLQNRKEKLKGSKIADLEEIQEEKRKKRFLEMQEEARKAKEGDEKPEVDSGSTEVAPPAEVKAEPERSKKDSLGKSAPVAKLVEEEKPKRRRKYTVEEDEDQGAVDFSEFEKKPEPPKPEPVKIASLNDEESQPRRRRKPRVDDDDEGGLDLSEFEKPPQEEETPKVEEKEAEPEKEEPKQKKITPVKIAALDTPDEGIARRRRKVTHEEDEEESGIDFNQFEQEAKKKEEEAQKEKLKEKIKKASVTSDEDKPMRRRRKKYDEDQDDGGIDFSSFEKPKEKKEEPEEKPAESEPEPEVEEKKPEPAPVERKKKLSREGGKQIVANFGEEQQVPRRRMKERMYSVDQPPPPKSEEGEAQEEELSAEEEVKETPTKKVSITEKAKPIATLSTTEDTIPRRRRPKHHDDSDEEVDPFANISTKVAKLPSPEVKPKRRGHHDNDEDDEFDVARIAAERQAEEERKKREEAEKQAAEEERKKEEEKKRLADLEARKKKLSVEGGVKVAPLAPTNDQPVRRRRRKYDDEESEDDFWKSQTQVTKSEPEPEPVKEPVKEPEPVKEQEPEPVKEEPKKEEEPEERKKKLSREGGLKIASLPSFDDPVPRRRRKARDVDEDEDDNPLFGKKEDPPKVEEKPKEEEKVEEKPAEKPKRILGGAKIVADLPPTEEVTTVRRKKKVSFEDERRDLENPIDAFAKSEQNKIANAGKKLKGLEPVDTGVTPIRRRNRYKDDEDEKYDPFAGVEEKKEESSSSEDKWYTDEETKHGDRRYDDKKSDNVIDIFAANDDMDEKPKKLSLRERMARRGR